MKLFKYNSDILPKVTLMGRDIRNTPHMNLKRITSEYIFYIITEGEIFFAEDGKKYHLKKGDCFLFEPDKLHYGLKKSDYQLIYIHFQAPDIICEEVSEDEFKKTVVTQNTEWIKCNDNGPYPSQHISILKEGRINNESTLKHLVKMADRAFERSCIHLENYNVIRACAAIEILIEVYRSQVMERLEESYASSVKPYKIIDIVRYIQTNYSRKLTGSIVEEELMYNFDYINQILKSYLNISFFKLLEQTRIEAAMHLLSTSDLPIKRVAGEVGYSDETYFYKVFKKNMGISPARYRKMNV